MKYPGNGSYLIPYDDMIELIRSRSYRSILAQIPEGLKREAKNLSQILSKETDTEVWIDGEPCFGACDHAGIRAEALGMDAVIHLGHAEIPSMDQTDSVPVHFFPVEMVMDEEVFLEGLEDFLNSVDAKEIGLVSTVQHMDLLKKASDKLEEAGRQVHIGDPGPREAYGGQVLGCSFHSARSISESISLYLYIGTGRFHPMGLYLTTKKPVWLLNPLSGKVSMFESGALDRFMRKRYAAITKAKEMIQSDQDLCIVVTTKPGQRRMGLARELEKIVIDSGYHATLVDIDLLDPMKIRSLGCKICCSTACPRIAVDDSDQYLLEGITLLTPVELKIALGLMSWDDYELDEEW